MQNGLDTDNNGIFGSFLDKDDFAVHWYHENLQDTRASRNYQNETTVPKFTVEYPVLGYTNVYTDMRQLIICNLADQEALTRKVITLENMQFVNWVGHRVWNESTKVCFLAKDYTKEGSTQIVHCILSCNKMFQKHPDNSLSHLKIDK